MKITGSCHCGAVIYEAELDPGKVGICHCTDCQTLSASAFRTIAFVDGAALRLTGETPRKYVKRADSGNDRIQAFCGTCGAGIYSTTTDARPSVYSLRVGTIDARRDLTPRFEIWCRSALPWLAPQPETEKHDGNPG